MSCMILYDTCMCLQESRATLAWLYRPLGRFYMLELNSVYTPLRSGCGLVMETIVIQFGNGQILIENALHSLRAFADNLANMVDRLLMTAPLG